MALVGLGSASRYLDPLTGNWLPTFVRALDGMAFTGDPGPPIGNLPSVETVKTWTDDQRQGLYDALRTQHRAGVMALADDSGLTLYGSEWSSMTPDEYNLFSWLGGIITADPSMRVFMLLPAAQQTAGALSTAVAGSAGGGRPAAPTVPAGPARYLINGREVYADGTPVPGGYDAQADAQRQLAEQGYPDVRVTADGRWYNIGAEPAQSYHDAHPEAAAGGNGTGPTDTLAPVNTLAAGMPLLLGLGLVGALIARGRRR